MSWFTEPVSKPATRQDVPPFGYIGVWYNRQRRHSSLGYITPEQARRNFTTATKIAA